MSKSDKNAEKTQKKVIGRPFKKGNKMSPGRPKKEFCIPDIIRVKGKELDPVSRKTFYHAMIEKAWNQAVKGDKAARDWISDRTEGKALDRIEATINQEPIKVFDIE
jgi:hypothetical protein